jgi:hypothetical protein
MLRFGAGPASLALAKASRPTSSMVTAMFIGQSPVDGAVQFEEVVLPSARPPEAVQTGRSAQPISQAPSRNPKATSVTNAPNSPKAAIHQMCQIRAKPVMTAKNALMKPIALFLGISIGSYSRGCAVRSCFLWIDFFTCQYASNSETYGSAAKFHGGGGELVDHSSVRLSSANFQRGDSRLGPHDQIVQRINIRSATDCDPSDHAPCNDSMHHFVFTPSERPRGGPCSSSADTVRST